MDRGQAAIAVSEEQSVEDEDETGTCAAMIGAIAGGSEMMGVWAGSVGARRAWESAGTKARRERGGRWKLQRAE
jgi:hypothetical protein